MLTPVTAVQGTWGRRQTWWHAGSPWWSFMASQGFSQATTPRSGIVFEWGTELGSSWKFWRHWWPGDDMVNEWKFAGVALAIFLDSRPRHERVVVAHSHGGQVALHAASLVPVHRLLTLGTPRRHDMRAVIERARPQLGSWCHVCDREGDLTGFMGALGDGRIDGDRTQPNADRNVLLEDIGHSGLLRDPALFPKWQDQALLAFLRS